MKDFDLDGFSSLGAVLRRRGSLTTGQLERALKEQHRRRGARLGDLLVELRLCTREEVELALHEQDVHRLPPPTEAASESHRILQSAFACVRQEVDRLTERRTKTMEIKISPDG